jgi:hypothetical protein
MRNLKASVLSGSVIELENGPSDPANLKIVRNGKLLEQGKDYNVGEGDVNRFINRNTDPEPYSIHDHFLITLDE